MTKSNKITTKWSKNKIISLVLAGAIFMGGILTLTLTLLIPRVNSLSVVGSYMNITGVNEDTLFVAKKETHLVGAVYADEEEELTLYNDLSTEYANAINVQFVLQDGTNYNPIKYYSNNNRIEDANNYINEIKISDGWYISTYSITEKFIFVKFQYNFDGVKFQPTKFLNMFGVYNSPLEFHTKASGNIGHEVVAIDRDTGLISSVVDVMEEKGYLIETPGRTSNQAGDMFVIEYNYTNLGAETARYTVGMYRGEVYIISSDNNGALQINKIITLNEIKQKITIQLNEYIEENPTLVPNGITRAVEKFLNSAQNEIEYAGDALNFFVDINGSILIYFNDHVPTINPNNSYDISLKIYGAAYSIDSNLLANYIDPADAGDIANGYKIANSVIIGKETP